MKPSSSGGRMAKSANDAREPSPDDLNAAKILHELQMNQRALQSQNSELSLLRGKLEASLARYQDLYDRAPIGYLTLNGLGRIVQINETGALMLARIRSSCIGLPLSGFFGGASQTNLAALMSAAATQPGPQREEFEVVRRNGSPRIRVRVEVLRDREANEYRVVMSDVTERHTLEQELVNMGHREQLRLGEALQDGLGQELAGLSLSMSAMLSDAQRGLPPRFSDLRDCQDSILGTISNCRALARGMAPLATFQGGISQALRDLVLSSQTKVAAAVAIDIKETAPITLPLANCDHLFRIASEALNNACLHSEANNIHMDFKVRRRAILLSVSDDGRGLGRGQESFGMGLRVMRYRARLIGAQMSIVSGPSRGTRVECSCRQQAA